MFVTTGFLIVSLIIIIYFWFKYKLTYWKRLGIRSPPSHWFFGHMKDAMLRGVSPSVVLGQLHLLASDKDDVLGCYIFHKPVLLLTNPKLIQHILVTDFHLFSNRYFALDGTRDLIFSKNLFSINNPEWKFLRSKMSPVFSTTNLKNLFHLILKSAETMMDHLDEKFQDGSDVQTILVRDTSKKFTTDVLSTLAFGIDTNSFEPKSEFYQQTSAAFPSTWVFDMTLFLLFFFPKITNFLGRPFFGEARSYFVNLFWDSMRSRESSRTKRGDMIDSLLDIKNQKLSQGDFKLDGDVLVAQSGILFVAGLETSATTISFTLHELAKNPHIQQRTREEIFDVIRNEGFNYESIKKMVYLNQVISETLRLYPPAPLIDRVAEVDYKIPGTDIILEKGIPVYVALCGIQRDPKHYSNPSRFDPERFNDENKNNVTPFTYMPFGQGRRMCIGMRVGLLQAAVGIISILKKYEITINLHSKVEVDRTIFLVPHPDGKLDFKKLKIDETY